jgi:fatty-acid peroxygenase
MHAIARPDDTVPMPSNGALDSTFALFADPYRFIGRRCRRLGSDVFEATLMMQRMICMTGAAAAEVFYDANRFQREGAAPEPLRATLFGTRSVQTLDDAPHWSRKALFVQVLNAERIDALARAVRGEWDALAARVPAGAAMPLYAAAQEVFTRAACSWAGVPLPEADVARRTARLVAMFDDAARGPLAHLHARRSRVHAEWWVSREIARVRAHAGDSGAGTVLEIVATHRDGAGRLLPLEVAAVELLNLLRPTVAISVFVMFAAHALQFEAGARAALLGGDLARRSSFIDEVRRHYPFFPALIAQVRESFTWRGMAFPRGRRVLLDIYGTNHDPRIWARPDDFDPDRFLHRTPTPFEFIPQGGATVATGHRCPGEAVTRAVMGETLEFLLHRARLDAAAPDPRIDMGRIPALPRAALMVSAR